MVSDEWEGLHCDLCIQRKNALDELAEWLKSMKKQKKDLETEFLNNRRVEGRRLFSAVFPEFDRYGDEGDADYYEDGD